eukprot:SAG31_NODE_22148_length_532_cov_1.325635_1_plen_64_part_01
MLATPALLTLLLLTELLVLCHSVTVHPRNSSGSAGIKPHLLFALVDDLGHFNVQLTNPEIHTPH